MPKLTVPGIAYSIILALGAWALDYFGVGAGAGFPLAPILIAAIPIVLKMFTVATTNPAPTPAAQARGMGDATSAQPSKMKRFILG